MCLNWINGLFQATDSLSLTQSAHCCPPLLPRLLLPLTHCSLLQCLNAEHQNRVWQIKCTHVSCFSSHPAASALCFLPGLLSDDDLFGLSTDDTYKPDNNNNGKSKGKTSCYIFNISLHQRCKHSFHTRECGGRLMCLLCSYNWAVCVRVCVCFQRTQQKWAPSQGLQV